MLASLTAVVHSPENKCPLVDRSGVSADQSPQGRSANRSLSAIEPVSAPPKWKLKNGDQSRILTHREIRPWRPDCLAEDAVTGEPVSGRNSLLTVMGSVCSPLDNLAAKKPP